MKRDVCVLQILVLLIPHVRTGKHPVAPSSVRVTSEAHQGGVYLKCSFETHPDSFLGFVVLWSRLSALGLREELRQETTVHTSVHIELDGFNLRLGDKIYCSSYSFFLDSPNVRSPAVDSAEFFAGLRVTVAESSVLEEGGVYQLLLESTVPLPCVNDSDHCSLLLQLSTNSQDEEQLGADVSLSSCAVELTSDPCADGLCSRASLHLSPIADLILDGNRTTTVSVEAIVTENILWSGYYPEPLQIQVLDVQSAYCYSFTDPHTVTFDGRSYENSQIGTFVLFRSAACGVEVQVRLWECGGVEHAASCVCGVVVRDGGDVVSFDMCDGELEETSPQLTVKHRSPQSKLRITESYQGRKLTMTLSLGAFVRADVSAWGMSLTVRASGADKGHTQGLCGTYDEDPHNDLHSADGTELLDLHSFISAWRLPPGSSLFDLVPPSLNETVRPQFCLCPHTAAAGPSPDLPCRHPGRVTPPSLIPSVDVTQQYLTPVELLQSQTQENRSSQYESRPHPQSPGRSNQEGFAYFFPEDHEPATRPGPSPAWPTPSGLREDQARAHCRETLGNSNVALSCSRLLPDWVLPRVVEMCVSDLKLKDDESWMNATLPLLENECERRLLEQTRRAEYPEVLTILRCPRLCSGNGQCSKRGCECFPGFGSYDCSALSDQVPEMVDLQRDVCDVHQDDCSSVRVRGHDFRNSRELQCEFVQEQSAGNEWVLGEPQLVRASFLDTTALRCQIPQQAAGAASRRPQERWQIRVSNDGYSYSNAKILTLYNGTCHICRSASAEVLCSLKEKKCYIDGVCYSEGERSSISSCLYCLSETSRHTWSTAHKNRPPVFQPLPALLRSFPGQTVRFQLEALDPEGSTLVFSLDSGPKGSSVSPEGLLMWRSSESSIDTHTFRVSVSDDCGFHTAASIQVSVLPCGCLNGGSCLASPLPPADVALWLCACPEGFRGARCEEDVDNCKPNPCRYARCIDAPNSFSCVCPPGMTGHTCREDVDECLSQPCFPAVSCNNTLGSFTCGLCPKGFTGDGRNCTKWGGQLQKRPASSRPSPQSPPSPCSRRPCHPGVQCFESVHVLTGFVCGPCPQGLQGNGRICRRANPGSVASRSDHFQVHRHDPLAPTSPMHSGPQRRPRPQGRNQTAALSPRSHSLQLSPELSARGRRRSCADTTCFPGVPCEPTSTGQVQCGPCPPGYGGDGETCEAVCKYPCGRNQKCSLPNTCTCKEGFTGYGCHIAVCRPDCKNQGRCVRPSVCQCPPGYTGATCEQSHCEPPCQHGGTCASRNHCTCPYGYMGPTCDIMVCVQPCEHGGECVSADVCSCKPGWSGPTCAAAVCDPPCSNGGTCIRPNYCICSAGFYGARCQIAVCNPPCKNGGQCIRNNVCWCPGGYTGRRCQQSVCEPACMNRAKCVGPNLCSCASGWSGEKCNTPVCLQRCENGGECIGPNTCQCPVGWGGLQCQSALCTQPCVNGGRCVLPELCVCPQRFSGLTCAEKAART